MSVKTELLKLYNEALNIKKDFDETDAAVSGVDSFIGTLEDISRAAYAGDFLYLCFFAGAYGCY